MVPVKSETKGNEKPVVDVTALLNSVAAQKAALAAQLQLHKKEKQLQEQQQKMLHQTIEHKKRQLEAKTQSGLSSIPPTPRAKGVEEEKKEEPKVEKVGNITNTTEVATIML